MNSEKILEKTEKLKDKEDNVMKQCSPQYKQNLLIGDEELLRKFDHMELDPPIYGGSIIRDNVRSL